MSSFDHTASRRGSRRFVLSGSAYTPSQFFPFISFVLAVGFAVALVLGLIP